MIYTPKLVVFIGYPHSGKSRVSRMLTRAGYNVISTDNVIGELYPDWSRGVLDLSGEEVTHAVDMVVEKNDESVIQGKNTVVDTCAVTNDYRRRLLTVPGCPVGEDGKPKLERFLVYLEVDIEELMRRNLQDPTRDEEGIRKIFEWMDSGWENPKTYTDDFGDLSFLKYPQNTRDDYKKLLKDLRSRLDL